LEVSHFVGLIMQDMGDQGFRVRPRLEDAFNIQDTRRGK